MTNTLKRNEENMNAKYLENKSPSPKITAKDPNGFSRLGHCYKFPLNPKLRVTLYHKSLRASLYLIRGKVLA